MKRHALAAVALCGIGLAKSAFAQAPQDTYFRAEVGYSSTTDANIRDRSSTGALGVCGNATCTTPGQLNDVGNSTIFGAGIGYRVLPSVRTELGFAYRGGYEVNEADAGNNRVHADIRSWNVMLNGFYDFDIGSAFRPYVGAGIGVANNRVRNVRTEVAPAFGGGTVTENGGNKTGFAWSLGAGIAYAINPRMVLDVGYRYVDLGKLRTDAGPLGGAGGGANYGGARGNLRAHEFVVALRL
jgi:opacity protein-like surface antigen